MILQIASNDRVKSFGQPHELAALREELTYDLGERRGIQQRMCLLDQMTGSFPIGLLVEVESALRGRGISVIRNDLRTRPAARRELPLSWLLPHQREAVDAALRHVVCCVDVPTAGGKGEIIAALCAEIPVDLLVLADDKQVLRQLGSPDPVEGRVLKRTGEAPGRVGDGRWEGGNRVTVASPATLDQQWDGNHWSERARALFSRARGVIYDEVHMAGSPRSQRILRALSHCYWRIGFSATVTGRADLRDAAVRAHFGPVGYRVPAAELEAQGVISSQTATMIRCDQPDQDAYEAGGYQTAVSLSKVRNGLVVQLWALEKTGIVTFVRELDHGRYLLKIAQHRGVRAEFVHGEVDSDERTAAIARFERGEVDVLIATNVFKQGADIVHAYAGINAAGGKSAIEAIQRRGRLGRICRTVDCPRCAEVGKKNTARWYDFDDQDSEAERTLRDRKRRLPGLWLKRHSRLRLQAYRDKGIIVEVKNIGDVKI